MSKNVKAKILKIGTLVVSKERSFIFKIGEVGVVIDQYCIGTNLGNVIIFERGGYDGFELGEIDRFLNVLPLLSTDFISKKKDYGIVMNINADFVMGLFSSSFRLAKNYLEFGISEQGNF